MSAPAIDFSKYAAQYSAQQNKNGQPGQPPTIDFTKYNGGQGATAPPSDDNTGFIAGLRDTAPIPLTNPIAEGKRDLQVLKEHPLSAIPNTIIGGLENIGAQQFGEARKAWQRLQDPSWAMKSTAIPRGIFSLIPIAGPMAGAGSDRVEKEDYTGAAGAAAGMVASALVPRLGGKLMPKETPSFTGAQPAQYNPAEFRGKFNKLKPGEQFTPAEQYEAAQDHGIQMDAAQATGNAIPTAAKKVTQYSLGGSKPFSAAQEGNVGALNAWADDYANGLSKHGLAEGAGSRIQTALQADLEAKQSAAKVEFSDLDKRLGGNTVQPKNAAGVAKQIQDEFSGYYQSHPELVPKRAWAIVQDVAQGRPASWSELHNLRSDLMEVYRRDPEAIKDRSGGWLQRMVGAIDNDMTDASSGLSPADKAQFRHANDIWQNDIKGTYDNPQHPLYHALRSEFPSQVPGMISAKAPELARQVNNILGDNAGDFQRATVEKIMGRDQNSSGYDFKGMPSRLKQYSPEYLTSLLGADKAAELYKIARVGRTVMEDFNPSGTAKSAQPAAEAATIGVSALHGNAAPAAWVPTAYGASKAMNNRGFVDYLMKKSAADADAVRGGAVKRGSVAAAVSARRRD